VTDSVESDYYSFMSFDPENARRVLRFYTQFFPAGPVLELACGPGVFLTLLRDDDIPASGVDIDDGMVRTAREAGHEVVLGDAVTHLRSLPDRSLRGLFAAHFLEHLPAPAVQTVYDEAHRVLEPGGRFVAAVPNAACMSVLGYDFWRDPTHVRFYDPLALQFFARQAGFAIVASGGNPFNHPGPPPELLPASIEKVPSLREAVLGTMQRAATLHHHDVTQEPAQDAGFDISEGRLWAELGNLLAGFDERLQTLQHDLHGMHRAYSSLLRQLYPANEVYVAAAVPDGPAGADAAVAPPSEAVVEGTV
jgi:SAM-dependent methyltransferase